MSLPLDFVFHLTAVYAQAWWATAAEVWSFGGFCSQESRPIVKAEL